MKENYASDMMSVLRDRCKRQIQEIGNVTANRDLDSMHTLSLFDHSIEKWKEEMSDAGLLNAILNDENMKKIIEDIRRPFVINAKKDIAKHIADIVETETNVSKKINEYLSELKERGIDLDECSNKEKENDRTDTVSRPKTPQRESLQERLRDVEIERERTLRLQKMRENRNNCSIDSCGGGGSGCGGGGC